MLVLAFVFGTPVVIVIGAILYVQLTGEGKLRRQLRNAKLTTIAALVDGQSGRVVGTAHRHNDAVLEAPLSGRPCLFFVARLEERVHDGKNQMWKELVREEKGIPFVLKDDSGRALVDPTGARVSLVVDEFSRSGELASDVREPREQAFIDRHKLEVTEYRTLRYFEAIIAEDERIAIYGAGVHEPDPDAPPTAAYRGEAGMRLHMSGSSKSPLLISDHAPTVDAD